MAAAAATAARAVEDEGSGDEGVVEVRRTGSGSTAIDPHQVGGLTRFYEKEFPDLEDLVMVNVTMIEEMGAYVQLLEYNNIEGMILLSELSRRRIRSINRLLRVGKDEVVMVIRVDKEKGYIDLSKRRASPEDIVKTEERFTKSKTVHSIIKHMSGKLKVPMLSLYTRIGWPLYKRYGHAFDAFQVAVSDPDAVFKDLDMTDAERAELCAYLKLKMAPQPLRIRADIQVTCVAYEGVGAIRTALVRLLACLLVTDNTPARGCAHTAHPQHTHTTPPPPPPPPPQHPQEAAEAVSTEAIPIKVQLIAPPVFVMLATTLDKAGGIELMTSAIAVAKAEIEKRGGQLIVKKAPTVTSSRDDSELQRMLAELEMANAEVSGDEDSDEDSASDADSDIEGGGGGGGGGGAAAGAGGKKKA